MTEQPHQLQNQVQEALDVLEKRIDEVIQIIWEGTSLKEQFITGEAKLSVVIPKDVQETSWRIDVVEVIYKMSLERLRARFLVLTQNALFLTGISLHGKGRYDTITFKGRYYKQTEYDTLELYFQLQ